MRTTSSIALPYTRPGSPRNPDGEAKRQPYGIYQQRATIQEAANCGYAPVVGKDQAAAQLGWVQHAVSKRPV